jgi:hypothetical protein
MARGPGRFATRVRRLREHLLSDLGELFEPCVQLPETFGNPARRRLFSPLANVLALSVPGLLCRRLVPGGREEVPGLAGPRGGRDRLLKDDLVL